MGVTTTITDQLDYTWANAPGTWSDADAGKPWSGYFEQAITCEADEGFSTAEFEGNAIEQGTFTEGFTSAELRAGVIAPLAVESWETAETLFDLMSWVHGATESFAAAEGYANAFSQGAFAEAVQTLEARAGRIEQGNFEEGFTMAEAMATLSVYLRSIAEAWATIEGAPRLIAPAALESVTTGETGARTALQIVHEAWATAEGAALTMQWVRAIAEAWQTTDAEVVSYAQQLAELWNTRDRYLRNAGGVVGDLEVSQTPLTLTDFANFVNSHSPTGYAPFKQLIAGDYLYQDAIVWMRLISQRSSTDTISISQAVLEVDVPDQFDSGSIDIPAGGQRVLFARKFNVVPDVVAQVVGGTQLAYPDISEIDETGFYVNCLSMANTSQSVEGVVSWKASGY
jgi:hypothetical protein